MPSDVLTVGDEVEVKVIGIKDGKISLSMKALEEDKEKAEEKAEKVVIPKAEDIGTNLGDLFKNWCCDPVQIDNLRNWQHDTEKVPFRSLFLLKGLFYFHSFNNSAIFIMHKHSPESLLTHSWNSYDSESHPHCICRPLLPHSEPFYGILCL